MSEAPDWKQDPDLVRSAEELVEPPPTITDERWNRIFEVLIPAVIGGDPPFPINHAIKLMTHSARRFVARHPDLAREKILEAVQMVAAALELEPLEVYPELGAPAGE